MVKIKYQESSGSRYISLKYMKYILANPGKTGLGRFDRCNPYDRVRPIATIVEKEVCLRQRP